MKLLFIGILVLSLAGCQTEEQAPPDTEKSMEALSAHGLDMPAPAAKANLLRGTVLERLDADRYSYLRLSTPSGEMWAAVLKAEVEVGDEVSVVNPMPMDGFETKTLNRKFDRIVFGTLAQPSEQDETMKILQTAHAGMSNPTSAGTIKVEKASGPEGRTVAEIFVQKSELKDQKVAVRGQVVKVNANILERTWIHLQDGTGDAASGTNDLTITTTGSAAVGDTILVEGTVRTEKSIGMGQVHSVIIEDATVTKQ